MKLDRALASGVGVIAIFNAMSGLTIPVTERMPGIGAVAFVFTLLVAHAAAYWGGPVIRARLGVMRYFGIQGALIFAVGLAGALFPVSLALYLALTTQAVILLGGTIGSMTITLVAVALFAISSMIADDLYRGATAGLILATTGVIAHAIAALARRAAPPAPVERDGSLNAAGSGLTARELEVLSGLARGARNTEIASELGIAERTVKAHLASIYQKLGVESRGAAVASARTRGILV